jgi:hypothetical protein
MITEARRQPGWNPVLDLVRRTGARGADPGHALAFRTKRQAWPYVGLAVVTRSSVDQMRDTPDRQT